MSVLNLHDATVPGYGSPVSIHDCIAAHGAGERQLARLRHLLDAKRLDALAIAGGQGADYLRLRADLARLRAAQLNEVTL